MSAVDVAAVLREKAESPTISAKKPRLLIDDTNPDQTVTALRDILAAAGVLYDRGGPVRVAFDQMQHGTVAQTMSPDALVLTAHATCRPYVRKANKDGVCEVDAGLPRSFAVMYLDWRGEWQLPPLNGIATAPLLETSGTQGIGLVDMLRSIERPGTKTRRGPAAWSRPPPTRRWWHRRSFRHRRNRTS
jgi:hypothetical protein